MGVDASSHPAPPKPSPIEPLIPPPPLPTDNRDNASEISRQTDQTSFSIPEDGSPITFPTRRRKSDRGKSKEPDSPLARGKQHSQTSLLIEYFEGGKGPNNVHSRPSVRVKVTPSAARKLKDSNDHIQITEGGRHRTPSYTRRISLSPRVNEREGGQISESTDDKSLSSYASATEESSIAPRQAPIEVEVMHKDPQSGSAASSPRDKRYVPPNASDISSMPPDSFLETNEITNVSSRTPKKNRSRSEFRDEPLIPTGETLKTPSRRRSRSLSRERITQRVIEKLSSRGVEAGRSARRSSKGATRSVAQEQTETLSSPRRRSSKARREDDAISSTEASLLTTSGVSAHRKSGDQASFRSGTSRSSHNNPRLLETVEDVIKRLILPELTALKVEQRAQHDRIKDRGHRDSYTSAETNSRDVSRRTSRTSTGAERPKVVLNRDEHDRGVTLSGDSVRSRKERRSHRDEPSSSRSERDRNTSSETTVHAKLHEKRSTDRHSGREAAIAGVVGGALTAAALRHHDSRSSVDDHEKVRKKRSKSRSRNASQTLQYEATLPHGIPPMPMSSDINSSEVTRESILTERTDRPHSAMSQDCDMIEHEREVSYGTIRGVGSPVTKNPTKISTRSPQAGSPRGIATHHSNQSRGDLSLHSVPSDRSLRQSKTDRHEVTRDVHAALAAAGLATAAAIQRRQKAQQQTQAQPRAEPPQLSHEAESVGEYPQTYYGHGRPLSTIESVASQQEDYHVEPYRDHQRDREAHRSTGSGTSVQSAAQARGVGPEARTLSKKEADLRYWDEQHEENERARHYDDVSPDATMLDYKHMTNYTDDSMEAPYLDQVAAGQHVLGLGANPEYRYTPVAASSAVASLHETSVLDVPSTLSARSKLGEV